MSTNYYVKSIVHFNDTLKESDQSLRGEHIGKRHVTQPPRFTWAMDPVAWGLLTTCDDFGLAILGIPVVVIADEFGRHFTLQQFIGEVLLKIPDHDYSSIGQDFS